MSGPFSGATLRKVKVRLEMDVTLPLMPGTEEGQLDRLDAAAALLGRAVRNVAVTLLVADVGEVKAEVDWAE